MLVLRTFLVQLYINWYPRMLLIYHCPAKNLATPDYSMHIQSTMLLVGFLLLYYYKLLVLMCWAAYSFDTHVFLCAGALLPDRRLEKRGVNVILRDGLEENFNSLDIIHPLSQTIVHELCHSKAVCGGKSSCRFSDYLARLTIPTCAQLHIHQMWQIS
jgi:hypothetical protein